MTRKESTDNLTAALAYAARGWRVHPLHDGSIADRAAGTPRLRGWPEKASCDEATIREWWEQFPGAWIGIATGPGSRLLVVDLDKKNGADGVAEWDELTEDDETERVAKTKHGLHLYYETDLDWPNSVGKIAPGIDVRGSRGYVVAPPSPGRSWVAEGEPGSIPAWLAEKLAAGHTAPVAGFQGGTHLDELLANMPEAGWNDWLSKVAGLYAKDIRHEGKYRAAVDGAADHLALKLAGTWEPGEVEKIATSIWEREQSKEHEDDHWHATFQATALASLPMRRARWLWDGRVPFGALTLLAGREGIGKSTTALDIGSSITRGKLPGEYLGHPKGVAIIATEDDFETTLIPRLVADHADLSRCFRIEKLEEAGEMELPVHIAQLEEIIRTHDIGLVILDPLLSRLSGKIDSYKDSDVRRALEPLGDMAMRTQCSVIGLIHVNKSQGSDPVNAIMGSRAFSAVCRSVLFASKDVKDEPRYRGQDEESERIVEPFLLGHVKCNVGPKQKTLLYSIDQANDVGKDAEDGSPISSSRIAWHGEVDTTIADAMADAAPGSGSGQGDARNEAAEWLKTVIGDAGGQLERGELMKLNEQHNAEPYSESTLKRALKKIAGRAISTRSFPKKTYWTWPAKASLSEDAGDE